MIKSDPSLSLSPTFFSITFSPLFWSSVPLFPFFLLNLLPYFSSHPSPFLRLFYFSLYIYIYLLLSIPSLSSSLRCRMLRCFVAVCVLAVCWAQDCQVANVQVMQNFDRSRVSSSTHAAAVVSNLWQRSPCGFRLVRCSYSMAVDYYYQWQLMLLIIKNLNNHFKRAYKKQIIYYMHRRNTEA